MDTPSTRYRRFVTIAAVAVTFFASFQTAQGGTVPRFETDTIPSEIAPATGSVVFGYLVVYENRNVADSKTIRLPVMIGNPAVITHDLTRSYSRSGGRASSRP
jgi:hypothetical protein